MKRIILFAFFSLSLSCSGGNGKQVDGGPDGEDGFNIEMYEFIDLDNPCELPPGVEPDPQWGAEVNPTGDPIGGNIGYSDILSPSQADYIITNRTELLDALAAAAAGQIIYIDDAAEVDMTGEQGVTVPGGVTLAGGRGRDGSPGGLIFTNQYGEDVLPLFTAGGEGVHVTGLRLRGTDTEIGDHDYETDYRLSRGFQSGYPSFEVDNCELWGWSHAALLIREGCTNAHIHHNTIHHNRRTGLGYGVCLGYSLEDEPIDVIIEANLFDYCRHHIASTGNPFSSYEARYNMVLEHANSSNFDRHGTVDPGQWVGGTGGDWTIVHHNTVWFTDSRSVGVRGVPVEGCDIYRNWFHHSSRDDAIWLFEEEDHGDMYSVYENFYGARPPPGTYLPVARAAVWPPMGRAPLTVTFNGSGSCNPDGAIVSYHWDFGNGETAEGSLVDYTFDETGRYNVTLTVTDNSGIPVRERVPVTVYPASSTYWLDFRVKDGYRGTRPDYYRKQALIDGQVIWEDDVAENEGWVHVSTDVAAYVEGKEEVTLHFRVISVNAMTDPENELIELDVYWDDVILFGGTLFNGDFENGGGWTYSESGEDVPWRGSARSGEVRSGNKAYWITHPYNTPSTAGTWGQVEQVAKIGSPDIRGRWLFDQTASQMAEDSSIYGNHGILVNMDPSACRVDGKMGRALELDGEDDYVDCGNHASLTSPQGTIELWISTETAGGAADMATLLENEDRDFLLIGLDDSHNIKVLIEDDDVVLVDVTSSSTAAGPEFHHVAVTQDGSGVKIYVDGTKSALTGGNSGAWTDHLSLEAAWMGRGPGGYFGGLLDHIVFYSRALAADEIRRHYEKVNPRGLWHFDEGSGTSAPDSSAFGNHGSLVNMDAGTCWIEGVMESALRFDGVDDYVNCGAGESLHLAEEMTIEMWIRFDSFAEGENVMSNNLYRIYHRGDWAGDRLYFLYRIEQEESPGDSAWDGWSGVATEMQLAAGSWYHIAAVKSGDTMIIYVNGMNEKEINCLSGNTIDLSQVRELHFGEEPFQGAIDEVTIYPRALSEGEIYMRYSESQ